MIQIIFTYLSTFLKKNFLGYFLTTLFLYLLFQQTINLDFRFIGLLEVENLWFYDSGGTNEYIMQLSLHNLILYIFGVILLVSVISNFFDTENMSNLLIKKPERVTVLFWFVMSTSLFLALLFIAHLTLLNVYLFTVTSSIFFIPSYLTVILIIPSIVYTVSVISFFSIITDSKFSNLALSISYLLIVPIIFGFAEMGTIQLPEFVQQTIISHRGYYMPSPISFYRDAFKFSLDLGSSPNWLGMVVSSFFFFGGSAFFIKKKVF